MVQERIAYAWAKAGSPELALGVARKVRGAEAENEAVATVIVGVAEKGEPTEATDLLAKAGDLGPASGRAKLAIVRAWIAKGKLRKAAESAAAAKGSAVYAEALGAVAEAYAKANKRTLAEKAAEQIDNPHWRGAAEAALAVARHRAKQTKAAVRVAKSIGSPWMEARAFAQMTVISTRRGRHKEARKFFSRAEKIVDGIGEPIIKSSAAAELVRTHLSLKRLADAEKTAAAIGDSTTRAKTLIEVMEALLDKDEAKAEAVLQTIAKNPLYADEAYELFAKAQPKRAKVIALAKNIRAPDARARVLAARAASDAMSNHPIEEATLREAASVLHGF